MGRARLPRASRWAGRCWPGTGGCDALSSAHTHVHRAPSTGKLRGSLPHRGPRAWGLGVSPRRGFCDFGNHPVLASGGDSHVKNCHILLQAARSPLFNAEFLKVMCSQNPLWETPAPEWGEGGKDRCCSLLETSAGFASPGFDTHPGSVT